MALYIGNPKSTVNRDVVTLQSKLLSEAAAYCCEDPDNDTESYYEYEEEDEGEEGEESCGDLEAVRNSSMLENCINDMLDSNSEEELVELESLLESKSGSQEFCEAIITERLPSRVFADLFELQHLV
nr:phosphatidylinositol-glycan biosynthesis class X protein [Ipomoea batatas]